MEIPVQLFIKDGRCSAIRFDAPWIAGRMIEAVIPVETCICIPGDLIGIVDADQTRHARVKALQSYWPKPDAMLLFECQ